jgi:hypothetical protein
VRSLEAAVKKAEVDLGQSLASDPVKRQIDEESLKTAREQPATAKWHQDQLTIVSPIDGYLICPELHEYVGRHFREGQDTMTVYDMTELEVVTLLEQRDCQQVLREVTDDGFPTTQVRPAGRVETIVDAIGIESRSASTSPEVPPPLTDTSGGPIAMNKTDPNHPRPVMEQFELRVKVKPETLAGFMPGQTALVRFRLEKQPLIQQWSRRLFQLIQQHQEQSNQGLTT